MKSLFDYESIDRRHLSTATIVLAVLSILKGFHPPLPWSLTHYVLTYEFGFIRRSLWGSVVSLLLGDGFFYQRDLTIVMLIVFGFSVALFVGLILNALQRHRGLIFPIFIYLTSPAFVFLASIFGYLDQVGWAITLTVLAALFVANWSIGFKTMYLVMAIVTSSLILIHEAQLLVFVPIILFAVCLRVTGIGELNSNELRNYWLMIGGWFLFLFGMTMFITWAGTLSVDQLTQVSDGLSSKVDFQLSQQALDTLASDPGATLQYMSQFWQSPGQVSLFLFSLLLSLPVWLVLLHGGFRVIEDQFSENRMMLKLMLVVVTLAPMLLSIAGTDFHRWNSYAVTNAFLALLILTLNGRHSSVNYGITWLVMAIMVVVNSMSTNYPVSSYSVSLFPFFEHIRRLADLIVR